MIDVVLRRFESPDEVRIFEKGRLELVRLGPLTIGRATYMPGWRWSIHVGPQVGASRCVVEHVGLVLAGAATVEMEDGRVLDLREGALFHVPPVPHDSRVLGDTPYVSLHLMGAESYARPPLGEPNRAGPQVKNGRHFSSGGGGESNETPTSSDTETSAAGSTM